MNIFIPTKSKERS